MTKYNKTKIEGWIFYDAGNWVEPKKWRETDDPGDGPGYQCFVKIRPGSLAYLSLIDKKSSKK